MTPADVIWVFLIGSRKIWARISHRSSSPAPGPVHALGRAMPALHVQCVMCVTFSGSSKPVPVCLVQLHSLSRTSPPGPSSVSQKSAQFLLKELPATTQVSPHSFSSWEQLQGVPRVQSELPTSSGFWIGNYPTIPCKSAVLTDLRISPALMNFRLTSPAELELALQRAGPGSLLLLPAVIN